MSSEWGPDADGVIALPGELTQRQAVTMLAEYLKARQREKTAREDRERIGELIKQYLTNHPEDSPLMDRELGIEAALQRRRGSDSYSTAKMPYALLHQLRDAGALDVNGPMVRQLIERSIIPLEVSRFRVEGGETFSLIVTQERNDG